YLKALIPQTTSNEPAIISPTVSGIVRLVDGGLFVQGFRGNVGIYSLSGTRVANVSVARNGFYRIALTPGEYAVKGVKK
ncbi:MAG TPA: hypothetical protein VLM37_08485, partial [Fibrobacteraceae bacterium]|nr:hypothetical protein [Fibrobacteraceae bacterium]